MDSLRRRVLGLTLAVVLLAVVAGGVLAVGMIDKDDGSARPCPKGGATNLTPRGDPAWALAKPQGAKLAIQLDYHVGEPRRASTYVNVRRMARGAKSKALPRGTRVGAFVLGGGLSNGSQGMGFAPVAIATRARDGRSVRVAVCVERPTERDLSAPGTYTGKVRVTGPRLRPVDLPVTVTIKGNVVEPALIAIFVSILGALAPFTTKPEAAEEDIQKHKVLQRLLAALPFVSGVAAGCLAAFLVYADDPTWGYQRGSDTVKLVVATYAAASAGLAATALPTKSVRRTLAQPPRPATS